MIKLVGYLAFFCVFSLHALVPVEGILMGDAIDEIQADPLSSIFSNIYDTSQTGENQKVRLYQSTFESGRNLNESCSYLGTPTYSTPWEEKQVRRSMAATLQYIGLDTTIKALAAYARRMDVDESSFKRLTRNLVNNYCSKNVTVFSLRHIEKSLEHYYQNPQTNIIPSVQTSPFATEAHKISSEKSSSRSKEFDLVIKNFRAFCSWGGEVEDYRLLSNYLNNKFIMAFVIKNMLGVQDKVDKLQKVASIPSDATVQVACTELICRKENSSNFNKKFPLSVGSTGIATDLPKVFCHHFRFQDSAQKTIPEVKAWIKAQELEDPIRETSNFIALMTGVPDLFSAVESYNEIPLLVRSSVDERWNQWARRVLSSFSKDLHYEESLKVKVEPRRDLAALSSEGFEIDLSVTLGEMDRLLNANDKIGLSFDLKLSKNFLRSIKTKWQYLGSQVDLDGKKRLREEIGRYLDLQLREKQKLFSVKVWNDDFSRLIADELVQQVMLYRGPLFDSFQDQVLRVPVKFSYGLFAMSYIRYRSDVAAGRLKLSL
jgi:hypothetical protein